MSTCWRFCSMLPDHDQPGRLGQAPDLVQGVVGVVVAVGEEDPDQDGLLAPVQTLGALEFDQSGYSPSSRNRR